MNDELDVFKLIRAPRAGCLFVFSGPSGAGKSTVCRALLNSVPDVSFSISHTTRQARADEVDGRDYFFINEDEFERLAREGKFAEYATVYGHRYGTSRDQLEEKLTQGDVLLDVDVQGARQIKPLYPAAISVFILPPSLEELRARLNERSQNEPSDIERRVAQAELEIRAAPEFDYFIVNDRLDDAVAAGKCIVSTERRRLSRRLGGR
jgi:guanylate kinase